VRLFRKRTTSPSAPTLGFREPRPWTTPDSIPAPERRHKVSLTAFLWARIGALQVVDPDGAEKCRQVMADCCERINLNYRSGNPPNYVPGEVRDWEPLLKLARNWADHPDFRPEWKTP
jgi:hypothetical protein